jgi:hypothetical protein
VNDATESRVFEVCESVVEKNGTIHSLLAFLFGYSLWLSVISV